MLQIVGTAAGSAAMLHAMTVMGHAQGSTYSGPIQLDGAPEGTKVLVLFWGCLLGGLEIIG